MKTYHYVCPGKEEGDRTLFPSECCRVLTALHNPPTDTHTETHGLSTGEALQG